jgi:predicted transcriptional regulator
VHASVPPPRDRMPAKPLVPNGRLECAIFSALWALGAASAREIHLCVGEPNCLGYTTTAKGLDRLHEKGLVERTWVGKTLVYCVTTEKRSA